MGIMAPGLCQVDSLFAKGGGFSPAALANLFQWYDLSDTLNFTITGSGYSSITDKSGRGITITQSTDATRPTPTTINGIAAGNFNAQRLVSAGMTLPGDCTVHTIVEWNESSTADSSKIELMQYTGTGFWICGHTSATISGESFSFNGSNGAAILPVIGIANASLAWTAGQKALVTWVSGATTNKLYYNGVEQTLGLVAATYSLSGDYRPSTLVTGTPNYNLGINTAARCNFKIGEQIIYNAVQGQTEINAIKAYAARWGIV